MTLKLAARVTALLGVVLFAGGCASLKMEDAVLKKAAPADKALVTFIRPVIMIGEAIPVYLWDGERFIGRLGSGSMVQYEATPGEHLFLANAENWSYATGSLEAGKRYVIKANMFPGFTMRVALASMPATDTRLTSWYSQMTPKAANDAVRAGYEAENLSETRTAIEDFRRGDVKSYAKILVGDGH